MKLYTVGCFLNLIFGTSPFLQKNPVLSDIVDFVTKNLTNILSIDQMWVMMHDDNLVTKDITTKLLVEIKFPVCVINDDLSFNKSFLKQKTSALIVLINDTNITQLKQMLEGALQLHLYDPSVQTIFTVCSNVENIAFLSDFMDTIWNFGIT